MTVCWFALLGGALPDLVWLTDMIPATPALQMGVIYTPATTGDPYLDDGPPPQLGLQLYFDDIAALDSAAAPRGHLRQLDRLGARRVAMHLSRRL